MSGDGTHQPADDARPTAQTDVLSAHSPANPAHKFTWPPRPLHAPPQTTQPPAPPSHSTLLSPFSAALTHIERTWLGLISPPWHVRAAEAGWRPSAPDDYCWRCGRTTGPFEVTPPDSAAPGCTLCRSHKQHWERFVRIGNYEGELKRAIQEVKFRRWRTLGRALGRELGKALAVQLAWERIDPDQILLVPVPSSWWRRMRSGIDHAEVIARGVQEIAGGKLLRPIRRRHGPSQLEVAPSERPRNAARSFVARSSRMSRVPASPFPAQSDRPGDSGSNQSVRQAGQRPCLAVVIDDVRTTGATMSAACRCVRASLEASTSRSAAAPIRLWAAVLGVTPEPGSGRGAGGPEGVGGPERDLDDPLDIL